MPCQWIEAMCPCTDPGGSALRTRSVTVVPSRQRSSGAGSEPLTVTAGTTRPVKSIGVSPITRSKSVPASTPAALRVASA